MICLLWTASLQLQCLQALLFSAQEQGSASKTTQKLIWIQMIHHGGIWAPDGGELFWSYSKTGCFMDPKRLNAAQPAVPRNAFNTYITYLTTQCSSLRPLFFWWLPTRLTPWRGIQLGKTILDCGFQVLDSGFFVRGTCTLDSNR